MSNNQRGDPSKFTNVSKELVNATGRFFSNLKILLISLLIYIALWITLLLWLYAKLSNFPEASFIAYEIVTGGDPYNFRELRSATLLWQFITFLHILSWIMVPILIAAVIDSTYQKYEERKTRAEKRLRRRIRQIGKERLNLSGEELDVFIDEEIEKMETED